MVWSIIRGNGTWQECNGNGGRGTRRADWRAEVWRYAAGAAADVARRCGRGIIARLSAGAASRPSGADQNVVRRRGPLVAVQFRLSHHTGLHAGVVGRQGDRGGRRRGAVVEEAKVEPTAIAPEKIERFDIGDAPEDPTELNAEALNLQQPARLAQEAEFNDESEHFEHRGGGTPSDSKQANVGGFGGFDIQDIGAGPSVKGKGGVGVGIGTGTHAGVGGGGSGFGGRGSGSRKAMLASGGGTKQSELAVLGALNWMARHQLSDGSWSLSGYKSRCKDNTCTGPGKTGDRPAAATALGLLPFLGAGQTHESKGRYKNTVAAGLRFLLSNEKANGDLRIGGDMYDQGLATIALCECYGMSNAKDIKRAAQAALNFVIEARISATAAGAISRLSRAIFR